MGKIAKSKKYLALTLTFIMLMANCISVNLISQNGMISTYECCDFSEQCEHSHTHCFEDEMLYNETTAKPCKLEIPRDSLLFTNPNFSNSFSSKIWQPPKNS
jgi:hypothetical protein